MARDDELIDALESAVRADPTNRALRMHLASMLQRASRNEEALGHLRALLDRSPLDVEALAAAADNAEALGDLAAAEGFRRRKAESSEAGGGDAAFREIVAEEFGEPLRPGGVTPEVSL